MAISEAQTESRLSDSESAYHEAFKQIIADDAHMVLLACHGSLILGCCHLTLLPSLTYKGGARLNIEAVRVRRQYRSKGIGESMITEALRWGREKGAILAQLTTNSQRPQAAHFYCRLGFEATHIGFKKLLSGGE